MQSATGICSHIPGVHFPRSWRHSRHISPVYVAAIPLAERARNMARQKVKFAISPSLPLSRSGSRSSPPPSVEVLRDPLRDGPEVPHGLQKERATGYCKANEQVLAVPPFSRSKKSHERAVGDYGFKETPVLSSFTVGRGGGSELVGTVRALPPTASPLMLRGRPCRRRRCRHLEPKCLLSLSLSLSFVRVVGRGSFFFFSLSLSL